MEIKKKKDNQIGSKGEREGGRRYSPEPCSDFKDDPQDGLIYIPPSALSRLPIIDGHVSVAR